MSTTTISSDDVISAYQEKLSEANYEIVLLRARVNAQEKELRRLSGEIEVRSGKIVEKREK